MILTKKEEAMAKGRYGPGLEKCINLLIKFGEVFNAEKLVKVTSAHVYSDFDFDFFTELTEGISQTGAFTTIHPFMSLSDPLSWEKMGVSKVNAEPLNREHEKRVESYNRLSFFQTYTCVPMLVGNFVKKGDFVSWFGSCPQLIANSIIGARQNRDGAVINMAVAITGRAPYYGLFLDENRYAEILVEIVDLDSESLTTTDYGAVGHYVGRIAKDRNIVINGLNRKITLDEMHYLLPPLSTTGAVSLCHIVGVTPEAPDLTTALGNKPPKETIHIGKEEISRVKEEFSAPESEEIDLVMLGCPHCTVEELKQAAALLKNKKVGTNQSLWIGTAHQIDKLAHTMGYSQIIESAGGVISRSCMSGVPDCPIPDDIKTIATNSFKAAYYISTFSRGRKKVVIGDLKDCINAAVNGKWEAGG